jgi:hypothetical protein
MSHLKPKRSRSARASRFEAVTAAIAGLTPKCIATIVELANGPLILMACPDAARCPRCDAARERRRLADAPKPLPKADTATLPEPVDGQIEEAETRLPNGSLGRGAERLERPPPRSGAETPWPLTGGHAIGAQAHQHCSRDGQNDGDQNLPGEGGARRCCSALACRSAARVSDPEPVRMAPDK